MIFKRSSNTKEDAVSPVVGVMLMLVVTVIIAAMVVAFSSGLAEDVEKANLQFWMYNTIQCFQ